VPKDKQYPFALETVQKNCSVRQTERAVKAFMTPATVLETEKAAKNAAVTAELKAFVERMRAVYKTKVTLVGNDKKGRIAIDYYCADDLYRFEEFLSIIENFQDKK
jgi:ParB family chromosome partitioning protein